MDVAEDKLRNGCGAVEALRMNEPAFSVWFEMCRIVKKNKNNYTLHVHRQTHPRAPPEHLKTLDLHLARSAVTPQTPLLPVFVAIFDGFSIIHEFLIVCLLKGLFW